MAYVGNTPTTQSFISGTDYFNGDGATIAFTLSRAVVSVNDIEAVVNNVVQQPNAAYTISGTTITFTSAPSAGTSNIYVRYLSTTTQSITPSQNTVSYSSLNSDNQSKLGISYKNRFINGNMVINQRGSASYAPTSSGLYTLDRWFAYASTGTVAVTQSSDAPAGFVNSWLWTTSSGGTRNSGDFYEFVQFIEGYNSADLNWGSVNAKTVTLSFWVKSSVTGTFGIVFRNSGANRNYVTTYTINSANTWEQKSITIAGDQSGTWLTTNGRGIEIWWDLGSGSAYQTSSINTWLNASGTSLTSNTQVAVGSVTGATYQITGVQLEVGTQATTFDYRSYGTELSLCQRYYARNFNPTYAGATDMVNAVVEPLPENWSVTNA